MLTVGHIHWEIYTCIKYVYTYDYVRQRGCQKLLKINSIIIGLSSKSMVYVHQPTMCSTIPKTGNNP